MGKNRPSRFDLNAVLAAINSLTAVLGADPHKNTEAVLRRTCAVLECECAVFAGSESDADQVCIRGAHNFPPSAEELAREICSRIICDPDQESVYTFSFPEISQDPAVQSSAGPVFRSAIGYPIKLSGGGGAVLTFLDSRPRGFDEKEQLLIAVSGMLLAVEELRRQSEEASCKRNTFYQKLSPTEIKVANLIRQGKVNKEIAEEINLTVRSVEVHRYHIRKKLGLKSMKINLQRYLAVND